MANDIKEFIEECEIVIKEGTRLLKSDKANIADWSKEGLRQQLLGNAVLLVLLKSKENV